MSVVRDVTVVFVEVKIPDGATWRKLSEKATPAALVILAHVVDILERCTALAGAYKVCGLRRVWLMWCIVWARKAPKPPCQTRNGTQVETIGSELMIVSGLPAASPQPRNTAHVALHAALAMLAEVAAAGMYDVRAPVLRRAWPHWWLIMQWIHLARVQSANKIASCVALRRCSCRSAWTRVLLCRPFLDGGCCHAGSFSVIL